jgi:hypothetical protein
LFRQALLGKRRPKRPGETREALARRQASWPEAATDEERRRKSVGGERATDPAEAASPPPLRKADHDGTGVVRCGEHIRRRWCEEHRLDGDSEHALHGKRRAGERTARVPFHAFGRAGEPQRHLLRVCEPGADLDSRPVVVAAGEEDEDRSFRRRPSAADVDRDVARCPCENRLDDRLLLPLRK